MLVLYNILTLASLALGLPLIVANIVTSSKRRETVLKRLRGEGLSRTRPKRPIWVHAVSVGEVIASVPLIKAMRNRYAGKPIVLSVGTLTGRDVAEKLLSETVDSIFFFPYDFVWSVRKAIRHLNPSLFILVESDIWPNVVFEIQRHEVPFLLVSARMSPKSFRGYGRLSFFMREVFSRMSSICVQTETDAGRFIGAGAPRDRVFVTGNIKFDQPLEAPSGDETRQLRASLKVKSTDAVLLAGSTHEGEEEILLRVFEGLKKSFPALVLVLAPRHPERAGGIKEMFQKAGLVTLLRTELNETGRHVEPEAVIVDTIGELRRMYAIADVVFVGKSLINLGGQNPLEPAALGKAMLFGPHMFNFELIARTLLRQGGAVEVAGEEALLETARALLADAGRRETMGKRARDVFLANRGAVERTMQVLERSFSP